jgi:two-component system KDP operon response regulator KdpE
MNLPDMQGIEVLKRLREWTPTPVVMLTVRDSDQDKVAALDAGADDYLTKPFSTPELLARLRVARRHSQPAGTSPLLTFGPVQIDLERRLVTRNGELVKLTPTEYALLRLLAQHRGRVLTHHKILREVWGPQYVDETHYLRVYFAQLRQKLEDNPALPQLIITEPGVGYRLVEPPPGGSHGQA